MSEKQIQMSVSEMIAIVKGWPADGATRIVPGYGLRGTHKAATKFHVEHAVVECSPGCAWRSLKIQGKWGRKHEIAYSLWDEVNLSR